MGIPFWDPVTTTAEGDTFAFDPWDTVFLGGVQLPGICTVKGLPTLAFDKKKAGGVDGATITVNGYLPGPIDIEVLLWTAAQFAEMERIAPKLWRKPNKKTNAKDLAVPIAHPAFALWGITAVVVLGVSVPERGPVEGSKLIKIKCVEFVAQEIKAKTKTAKAASNVPIAPQLAGQPSNRAGDPPSKTGIHPGGQPVSKKGGVS
jgi:hypothetical protein